MSCIDVIILVATLVGVPCIILLGLIVITVCLTILAEMYDCYFGTDDENKGGDDNDSL